MKCACSFTPVLAIIGLVGLGVGGYNMLSNGCPLGTCQKPDTGVVSTSAPAAEQAPKECPLACGNKTAGSDGAQVILASDKPADASCTEKGACEAASACADSTACCKGKQADECCKSKNDGHCPGTAEACGTEAKGQCPFTGATAGGAN